VHVISLAWDVMVRYSGQASGILQQPSRGLHHLADATGGVFPPMAYGREYPDLDAPLSLGETLPSSVINRVDRTNQMNPWPQDRPEQAFRRALAALRASHTVSFRYQAGTCGAPCTEFGCHSHGARRPGAEIVPFPAVAGQTERGP
jgi:hypothetical protein